MIGLIDLFKRVLVLSKNESSQELQTSVAMALESALSCLNTPGMTSSDTKDRAALLEGLIEVS